MGSSRARVAAVALLLAVAVVGLRAQGTFSHQANSPLARAGERVITGVFGVAEGAGLVACVLLLALTLPRPRRPPPEDEPDEQWPPPLPWWAKTLLVLFALAVAAAPMVILLTRRGHRSSMPPKLLRPLVPHPGPGHLTAAGPGSLTWPLLAGVLLAVAAVLILVILARRSRRRNRARPPGGASGAGPLAEGLAAGRDALLAGREPRAAIIACYAAMERGFAAAGSEPAAADTPAEVLSRASAAGLIRSGSAATLTGLFRRARYSSQPMTSADSAEAAAALDQMRGDLTQSAAVPS